MTSKIQKKIIPKIVPEPGPDPNANVEKQDIKIQESKDEIELDSILDKKLVNFDNKLQMSMFFIAYKSIDALYKELSKSANYTIPDEIIKRVVLETVPSLIKDYNSNLRKRCRGNVNGNVSENGLDDTICLGRKIDGTQCTRKKYNNNDFCKNHIKKLCNGRVDIPLEESNTEPAKIETLSAPKHSSNTITIEKEKEKGKEKGKEKEKEIKTLDIQQNTLEPVIDNNTNNTNDLNSTKPQKTSKRGRKSKIQFDPRQYDNEYITLWEDIVEGEKVLIDNANNIYTYDLEHPVYIGKKDVTVKLGIRQIIDSLAAKCE